MDLQTQIDELRADITELRARMIHGAPPRPQFDDGFLSRITEVYSANINHAPTQAVADTFGVKHRTAGNYVKRARDAGKLPAWR